MFLVVLPFQYFILVAILFVAEIVLGALMFVHRSEVKQTMGREFMGGLWKVKFSHGDEEEGLRKAWDSLQQGVSVVWFPRLCTLSSPLHQ